MKKTQRKSALPAITVVLLLIGTGIAYAGINNGQGVPSAKCSASCSYVGYTSMTEEWFNADGLT